MPAPDKNGTNLKVGDPVKLTGKVATVNESTGAITVTSSELDYPNATFLTVNCNSRTVVKD